MMTEMRELTVLCLASYEKGLEFLAAAKALDCTVILVTLEELREVAWPREVIDELYFMPDLGNDADVRHAISYLARDRLIDLVVPLDDYDVETVAALREHLRLPGMGETTARYFRDKLAMRVKAQVEGIRVPEFVHVLNYDELRAWMSRVPAPWVLKPRSEASAVGIKRVHDPEELWQSLDMLGDRQSYYVLEKYVPGQVYHIDAIVWQQEVCFSECHRYAAPPLDVMHEGGIFATMTLPRGSEDEERLRALNRTLLSTLGLLHGVTHTEFIKHEESGEFYFLETAARVGGAHIDEMIEEVTGINLWREWARLEVAHLRGEPYEVPAHRTAYGGIVLSLARQAWPDTSAYTAPEIVSRIIKRHHAGLIFVTPSHERLDALVQETMSRFAQDFMASLPAPDTLIG